MPMKPKSRKKLSPQLRKMILRRQKQARMRAIVRFSLATPDKILARLKDEKNLKIARWLSKDRLTAILELDIEEIEDLADSDFVTYIEAGGKLSASTSILAAEKLPEEPE